jgi:hypothetical protein
MIMSGKKPIPRLRIHHSIGRIAKKDQSINCKCKNSRASVKSMMFGIGNSIAFTSTTVYRHGSTLVEIA